MGRASSEGVRGGADTIGWTKTLHLYGDCFCGSCRSARRRCPLCVVRQGRDPRCGYRDVAEERSAGRNLGDIRYTGSERYSYGWGVPSMDEPNVASFTYESVYGKLVWAETI
jgi:hypothetical protein